MRALGIFLLLFAGAGAILGQTTGAGLEINVSAAGRGRINFSSKLLRLARVVEDRATAAGN